MAAIALPINTLIPVVDEARVETSRVASCSNAKTAETAVVLSIAKKTLKLRWKLAHITHVQEKSIEKLLAADFSTVPTADIKDLAEHIDKVVEGEREILRDAQNLGVPIRFWWRESLIKMAGQVEHLDSISESLHVAVDLQTSALLTIAVEHLAK